MGTILNKDTRRISFDNTISVNPILIQKSINSNDDIVFADFDEESTNYIRPHHEEQDYWGQRIDRLKNEHQVINEIIEREYEKTIKKTDKLFEPKSITKERLQKLNPCFDWRSKIVRCYEENPRQPLVCSAVVQAFNKCVISCQLED